MNETQKRYTVEQITKFNSEANDYEKKSTTNKWFIYGCIMIIILTSHIEGMKDIPDMVGLIAGIVKDLGMTIGFQLLSVIITLNSQLSTIN